MKLNTCSGNSNTKGHGRSPVSQCETDAFQHTDVKEKRQASNQDQ